MTIEKDNPLRAEKRRKLHELKKLELDPFPHNFQPTHKVHPVVEKFGHIEIGTVLNDEKVKMAGRLMTRRDMGKAAFFNFQDQTGSMQAYIRLEELQEKARKFFEFVDIGDIIGIEGFVFKTKKGELSIHITNFAIICKSLEPLPEKFHGIADVELKYRHRHLI